MRALREACLRDGTHIPIATHIQNHPGQGVAAQIGGVRMRLGSPGFAAEITGHTLSVPGNDTNESWVALVDGHGLLAWFALADTLRADAASTVSTLKQLGIRIHLLSGDGEAVVSATARTLQIDTRQSDALPETKLAYVKNLQRQGRIVAMVGDGINDAPVLAASQTSIAMGEGAEVTQAAADMVMLGKHLAPLAEGITLARKTRRIIYQNFPWALGYNLVAILAAALGYVTPWIAGIGMSASSLLVLLNALRLAHVQARDLYTLVWSEGCWGRTDGLSFMEDIHFLQNSL